ncbi:hypothetical protein ABBQ32_002443 [Trebouxia sp. C0010 RCD-2024]
MGASVDTQRIAPSQLVRQLNEKYEKAHKAFEDNFWATKMNLKGNSSAALAQTKTDYDAFLGDAANLQAVRNALQDTKLSPELRKTLEIMQKTFLCYITEDPQATAMKEKLNQLEADLGEWRNQMELGYHDPKTGKFEKRSSVQLRNTMRTDASEDVRKACWEGMRTVGPHVVSKFCDIIKLRNRLARNLGYEDFYDYKVKTAEGFSKRELFQKLAPLEEATRPIMAEARTTLQQKKSASALQPWNISYSLSGDIEREMDPFFPFEEAVDVWARTFAGVGIQYKGATMRLDLCDRPRKYSNGFCHWPQPAWRKEGGEWVPSQANFTSLATPNAVGSGKTALNTLLHEGGHAAHFANIDQGSPLFSQERAPTSVAYAENQSMFLDSFIDDAAWKGRYAVSRDGKVIPWDLVRRGIEATHPYSVFMVRSMLAVPFFEKALYELPEDRVTPQGVTALADSIEQDVEGGLAGRPLMSVPHILADESSAYYHAYVLAEMSVHQTRAHFKRKYGEMVDNPKVGQDLEEIYWRPGNGTAFLDLVQQLTGEALTADAWVSKLKESVSSVVQQEEQEYKEAVQQGPKIKPGQPADLGMHVILVHGDEVIADSEKAGSIQAATAQYKEWLNKTFPST